MHDAGCKVSVLAPHAGAKKPDQQVGILQAPTAIGRIEAVHLVEIAAPHCEVTGPRTPPGARPELAQRTERQRHDRRQPVDPALPAQRDPLPEAQEFHLVAVCEHPFGEFARQEDAIAGHEPARLGKAAVHGNEIGSGNAVAVQEDAIAAPARQNGAVARLARPEASILLPDMLERNTKPRGAALDELTRRRA
jgi:hypothetical protein